MATSQVGRPDDGLDYHGFFNTEYCVNLKPKEEWRPVFHQDKEELIAAMNRELEKIPGVIWNFSQPIEDNMEEAVSGVKGQLATKIYGDDLRVLEAKGHEIVKVMRNVKGIKDLGLFRVVGQPNLNFVVDREQAARYQINVADVQDAVQTAVGGNAANARCSRASRRYDLVMRYLPPTATQGRPWRTSGSSALPAKGSPSPSFARWRRKTAPRRSTAKGTGAMSQSSTACGAATWAARSKRRWQKVEEAGEAAAGVLHQLDGRVREPEAGRERALLIIVPADDLPHIHDHLRCLRLRQVGLPQPGQRGDGPIGGLLALLVTGTHFSVSSGVGFLALFGVSVQTGVVMVEYINQLRARGYSVVDAAIEGATRRLRPIMMTMLVATLGLLPAAMSHAIGSDSQRPFAIVIVGGLITDLFMSIFLLPTFYVWWASPTDRLPKPEESMAVDEMDDSVAP